MQEVAINSSGQLAVQTEEGFSWVTPEEYHANREQYYPITNSQLLDARANSPSLAFQNNVFETSAKTIIQNGVGEFVFDVQKGQSAKVFLFENNLKPYKSVNPLNARLTVTTTGCIIEWDEFKSTREGICQQKRRLKNSRN